MVDVNWPSQLKKRKRSKEPDKIPMSIDQITKSRRAVVLRLRSERNRTHGWNANLSLWLGESKGWLNYSVNFTSLQFLETG